MGAREKKQMRESERGGMKERICRALDLCPDVFAGESHIEIRGRGCVTVSGCGKILTYTPHTIRLSLKKGALLIEGERLLCSSYCAGAVRIDGCVRRVEFEEESL